MEIVALLIFFIVLCAVDIAVTIQNTREIRASNRQPDGKEISTNSDPLAITQSTDTRGLI